MKLILSIVMVASVVWGQAISPSNIRTYKQFKNYVINPDAENNVTAGITNTMDVLSRDTTNPLAGLGDFLFSNSASGQKLKFKLNSLPSKFKGQNLECSFFYQGNNAANDFKYYVENSGGTKVSPEVNLNAGDSSVTRQSDRVYAYISDTVSNPYYLVIESTVATIRGVYADEVHCGEVTSIGQFNSLFDGTSYTPTISASFGTPTGVSFKYWREGDHLIVEGFFLTGTTTAAIGSISLPAGLTLDTNKINKSNTTSGGGQRVGEYGTDGGWGALVTATGTSTTLIYFAANQTGSAFLQPNSSVSGTVVGSSTNVSVKFRVPIQGWSSSQSATPASQADWDWRDETCTGSWVTNTTYACKSSNKGGEISIKAKVSVSGAPTSAALTLTLPNSWVIDTTRIPGTVSTSTPLSTTSGVASDTGTNLYTAFTFYNSTTSVRLMQMNTTASVPIYVAITQAAPFTFGSTDFVEFEFKVPIVGYYGNQRAPTLTGSVTSNTVNALRIESVRFAGATDLTACTSTPCTLYYNTGPFTSVTRSSAGIYTVNWTAGTWSSVPFCTTTASISGTGYTFAGYDTVTSTSFRIYANNFAGTNIDSAINVTCFGSR